jgi:UDP-2,3-diacylglucosamine pyrophosphatase LpxH
MMSMKKRKVEIVVISDTHLGTAACRAEELLAYLKSIDPGMVILNGDIIDMHQFTRNYWPETHTKIVRRILKFCTQAIPVYYITGNHERPLRTYSALTCHFGSLHLVDRLELTIDGRRTLFIHGDHEDERLGARRLIARFASRGYDIIERFSNSINRARRWCGRRPISLTNFIKSRLSQVVEWTSRFENLIAETAARENCESVICGHIHQPRIRPIAVGNNIITYHNSGDWVEHGTALEYVDGVWSLVHIEQLLQDELVQFAQHDETRAVG